MDVEARSVFDALRNDGARELLPPHDEGKAGLPLPGKNVRGQVLNATGESHAKISYLL